MTSSAVSVVIVNWNGGPHLKNCIASILEYGNGYIERITVVDNGSSDNSLAAVRGLPRVVTIEAGENLGFARACNLGARGATSDFLLFLNPDATVFPDTLPRALGRMSEPGWSNVGICGVQLVDGNGVVARSCARFPNALGLCLVATGMGRLFRGKGVLMEDWDHDQTRDVDHVIGAFYLVRRSIFGELGGFDERFFVYLEDLDFSLRARQRGWRSRYLVEAQAFHLGGGTSNQVKDLRLFYSLRSRILYAFKNFSRAGAFSVLIATSIAEPLVRLTWSAARFSWKTCAETSRGYRMLYSWMLSVSFDHGVSDTSPIISDQSKK